MKKEFLFLVVVVVFGIIASCSKDSITTYVCTGITPTYTDDIKAIMDNSCALSGCHSANSHEAGVDLSSYAKVKSATGSSNFLGSIQHKSGFQAMPQGAAKLDDNTIQLISCWVQNGTPE